MLLSYGTFEGWDTDWGDGAKQSFWDWRSKEDPGPSPCSPPWPPRLPTPLPVWVDVEGDKVPVLLPNSVTVPVTSSLSPNNRAKLPRQP